MNDLRLGQRVEVLHALFVGEGDHRIQDGREWVSGTIVGLHLTSVHIRLDGEFAAFALSAEERGRNWRVP